MEKVPDLILLSMIRTANKDQLQWTIEDFIGALEREVKVRESHAIATSASSSSEATTAAATSYKRECYSEHHAEC